MQTNNAAQLNPQSQSLYEILEVVPNASHEEIHQAFLRAKQTYSSESPALYSIFSKEEADELLRMIEDAYSVLGNPLKRKQYDDKLKSQAVTQVFPEPEQAHHTPNAESKLTFVPKRDSVVDDSSKSINIGRTNFGNYKVDSAMEEEIKSQQIFDGTFIQKVRLYKNVDLDQLSKVSRIGRNYLVAVEANDFHSLPAPVFVRGFVSQLARHLSLPEKLVVESFMKLYKQSLEK